MKYLLRIQVRASGAKYPSYLIREQEADSLPLAITLGWLWATGLRGSGGPHTVLNIAKEDFLTSPDPVIL